MTSARWDTLEEMQGRITGSRLGIIEDASHLCFAEQPRVFNDLANSFLTEQESV